MSIKLSIPLETIQLNVKKTEQMFGVSDLVTDPINSGIPSIKHIPDINHIVAKTRDNSFLDP